MRNIFAAAFAFLLAGTAGTPAFADSLESIKSSGTFNIGFRSDAKPFAFMGENGRPAGYSIELCDIIAGELAAVLGLPGLNINYVPITAANRMDKLEAGEIDIECGSSTNTLKRRERVDFSLLTFITGAELLTHVDSGITDLKTVAGRKVGVLGGTTTEQGLNSGLARRNITAEIVAVKNHEEGLSLLESGGIDAYFADRVLLILLAMDAKDSASLKLSGHFYSFEPYALMLRKGDDRLRLITDRTLAGLYRSGDITKVYRHWFGKSKPSDLLKALFVIQGIPAG